LLFGYFIGESTCLLADWGMDYDITAVPEHGPSGANLRVKQLQLEQVQVKQDCDN